MQAVWFSLYAVVVMLLFPFASVAAPASKGATTSAQRTYPVSQADLAHGEKQLRQMLKDRPNMAKYVKPGDSIWVWTVRQFAGEGLGSRINWSSQTFDGGGEAVGEHIGPVNGRLGSIMVNLIDEKGRAYNGERLWAAAAFELLNIANSNDFKGIFNAALEGQMSKAQWTHRNLLVEVKAVRRLDCFYESMWLPNLNILGLHSRFWPDYSAVSVMSDEALVQDQEKRRTSTFNQWSSFYSNQLVPYLAGRKRLHRKQP